MPDKKSKTKHFTGKSPGVFVIFPVVFIIGRSCTREQPEAGDGKGRQGKAGEGKAGGGEEIRATLGRTPSTKSHVTVTVTAAVTQQAAAARCRIIRLFKYKRPSGFIQIISLLNCNGRRRFKAQPPTLPRRAFWQNPYLHCGLQALPSRRESTRARRHDRPEVA